MSESSIPFQGGATAVMPAPAPAPDLPEDLSTGEGRNRLLLFGGAAVLLVLAVAGYFLFFAGGPAEPDPVTTPPKVVTPAAPETDTGTTDDSATAPLNRRNFGRDPFAPLIVEAPPAAVGTTTNPGTTTDTTGTTGGTTGSGVSEPVATVSHSFRVVSVAPDNGSVDVKVDGKTYNNLHAGEVFATYFKVVLISGTTNAFQYGEEKFNVLGTKRLTIA